MIYFNDKKYFAKGTCNVLLEDISTGDILLQSDKVKTSGIQTSADLSEIRSGDGNPVAGLISANASLTVNIEEADFRLWAKGAQVGAEITYSAPVQECQIVTAETEELTVDVTSGVPAPELGSTQAYAYVQKVGRSSAVAKDGKAYKINRDGEIEGFTAVPNEQYKVWYHIHKPTAKKAVITSLMNPIVVRCIIQIAVFTNRGDGTTSKAGWLYFTIPYMKLQASGETTGNQADPDSTTITGSAIAFRSRKSSTTLDCMEFSGTPLGYMVFVPNKDEGIVGIAVVGGVVITKTGETEQMPVRFVMDDGSLQIPADYRTGFVYEVLESGTNFIGIDEYGIISPFRVGSAETEIYYTDTNGETYSCGATVIVEPGVGISNLVGYAIVGVSAAG